ncbi:MAG: hypothetical protein WBQ17_17295 [Rhizomicrobium sp.]
MSLKTNIARRPLLASLLGVAGLAVVGGGVYEGLRNAARRYPPTPYDDLLYKLSDRESAKALGAQVLAGATHFDPKTTAKALRLKLRHKNLARVLEAEITHGDAVELRGWVIPQTLASLCALAAKAG